MFVETRSGSLFPHHDSTDMQTENANTEDVSSWANSNTWGCNTTQKKRNENKPYYSTSGNTLPSVTSFLTAASAALMNTSWDYYYYYFVPFSTFAMLVMVRVSYKLNKFDTGKWSLKSISNEICTTAQTQIDFIYRLLIPMLLYVSIFPILISCSSAPILTSSRTPSNNTNMFWLILNRKPFCYFIY